jgi:hypothetical protein
VNLRFVLKYLGAPLKNSQRLHATNCEALTPAFAATRNQCLQLISFHGLRKSRLARLRKANLGMPELNTQCQDYDQEGTKLHSNFSASAPQTVRFLD